MNEQQQSYVMLEIDMLLDSEQIEWKRDRSIEEHQPEGTSHDPVGFVGHIKGWRFAVASFLVNEEGFPPDARGYSGAASNRERGLIMHLPAEVSQRMVEQATTKTEAS